MSDKAPLDPGPINPEFGREIVITAADAEAIIAAPDGDIIPFADAAQVVNDMMTDIDIGTDARTEPARDIVAEMRAVADFIESKPILAAKMNTSYYWNFINIDAASKEEFIQLGKQLGACEKGSSGEQIYLRKKFGMTYLDVNCQQNLTCERVKVGVKTIPAQEEKTVDVFEWKCPESILALGRDVASSGGTP